MQSDAWRDIWSIRGFQAFYIPPIVQYSACPLLLPYLPSYSYGFATLS